MSNAVQLTKAEPEAFTEAYEDQPGEVAAAPPLLPPRRGRGRWLVAIGAVVALAAGGSVWFLRGSGGATATVETVKVDRGRIAVSVTASGTVSALKTVLVGSQVSGRVAELHADFNDQVKKGQLLARLDTQLFRSAVTQAGASHAVARANVKKAEAQLQDAERQLARGQALGAANFLAAEQVEQAAAAAEVARAALVGARAQAQQAGAQLEQAKLNLAMTAIHSPIDGVVISRSVDVGQTVAASLQAPTVFTLAEDLRKMQVEAHVAESDVAKLSPGMAVTFTVDAFPGRKFAGKLRQVRNAALTVQNVVTYDAIVDVDNPALELRPGMTANVTFVIAEKDDVLRIPNAALRFRPAREGVARPARGGDGVPRARPSAGRDASDKMVFVPGPAGSEAKVQALRVKVGISDGSHTELVAGPLSEGTALVSDVGGATPTAPARPAGGPMGGPMGPGMGAGRGGRF